ncbi:hypothetical protein TELCIR_10198, partial [Teladorsagia circumcincta]
MEYEIQNLERTSTCGENHYMGNEKERRRVLAVEQKENQEKRIESSREISVFVLDKHEFIKINCITTACEPVKERLIKGWQDFTGENINIVVRNFLYDDKNEQYERWRKLEKVSGLRREYFFYGVCFLVFLVILRQDPLVVVHSLVVLICPAVCTMLVLSEERLDGARFWLEYWIVYAVMTTLGRAFKRFVKVLLLHIYNSLYICVKSSDGKGVFITIKTTINDFVYDWSISLLKSFQSAIGVPHNERYNNMWLRAETFSVFVLSRIIGGLSKANVNVATAIVSDVYKPEDHPKGMALIGISYSVGFLIGPMFGAYFSTVAPKTKVEDINRRASQLVSPQELFRFSAVDAPIAKKHEMQKIGIIYFIYLFLYAGLEFTLPFLTHLRFNFDRQKRIAEIGMLFVVPAFLVIAQATNQFLLYFGLFLYAV